MAIKYKDSKDSEIKELNLEIDKFKNSIKKNNDIYESLLDRTTESLEQIIKKTESSSKIQ